MKILSVIAMPAVWLLSISTSFLVRLIGLKDKDNSVTEEEIKSLIKNGTEAGEVRPVEQNIMERARVGRSARFGNHDSQKCSDIVIP